MPSENSPLPGPDADAAAPIFDRFGIPDDLLQRTLSLTQQFGPELLTAVLGYMSIYLINKGSSRYGDLKEGMGQAEEQSIRKEASEQIALGSAGMAATAFAAGNPLFAYPEVVAVIASLKPYLENRYPAVARVSEAARLDILVKMAAVGVGGYVTFEHADTVLKALPPLSLGALSVAFSGHLRQEVYRVLTLAGGSGLVVGSTASAYESIKAENAVGAIMSIAFFALNALFTRNEWKEVQRMGGVLTVVAGACDAVWQKVRGLTGRGAEGQ